MLGLSGGIFFILVLCIVIACLFEFINGFHDTANAVATVIYTRSMKPFMAVGLSGVMNFLGVFFGGITVAIGIMKLLPANLLMDHDIAHNVALIMALLITAIIWNLGTWYFGLPCSSSHTLLGSIFGVGIAYGLLPDVGSVALNWAKVKDVVIWLLLSPVVGFILAWGGVVILKKTVKYKKLYREPHPKKSPPFWVRLSIILSSIFLSYSHGQNDGQKGVGLVMIILIALVPVHFAVNHHKSPEALLSQIDSVELVINKLDTVPMSPRTKAEVAIVHSHIDTMQSVLAGVNRFDSLSANSSWLLRSDLMNIEKETKAIFEAQPGETALKLSDTDKSKLKASFKVMKDYVEYAPVWVIFMISFALGLGTMIGWKRIVVTIGEKIGKEHLNYAQGASSNIIAATTISLSSQFGLPVSTTQILSSGVAGSMVATQGVKNLRMKTIKNIFIAWVLTIPVTIVMSGLLFLLFRAIF
jgi:PiT family inorganic phosphate transporter